MATMQTDYIAYVGPDSQYVGLKIEATTSGFVLTTEYVNYMPGFRNITEQISVKFADDEDEAIEIATDMEHEAAKFLKIMDVAETTGGRFGELVQKWLSSTQLKAA